MTDMVNHPPHYVDSSVTIEPIEVLMYMDFCKGNAMKYVIRAGKKGDFLEDIKKAYWYLQKSHEAPDFDFPGKSQYIFAEKLFEFFVTHSNNQILKSTVSEMPNFASFFPCLELTLKAIIESSEKGDTI